MRRIILILLASISPHLLSHADEELDERLKAVMILFDKKHHELNVKIEELETAKRELTADIEKLRSQNLGLMAENQSLRKQLGLSPGKQVETVASSSRFQALQSNNKSRAPSAELVAKVNVNVAGLEELEELPGVGPVIAQRIVDNRPYATPDDLLKVRGIGKTSIELLRPLVRVK